VSAGSRPDSIERIYGVIVLRIPACSADGSGADVTGWVGAATGLLSAGLLSTGFAVCSPLRPRRIELRAAGVEPVVVVSALMAA
jgi:hypothetical protein